MGTVCSPQLCTYDTHYGMLSNSFQEPTVYVYADSVQHIGCFICSKYFVISALQTTFRTQAPCTY